MKKILALILCTLMLLGTASALATGNEFINFPVVNMHETWDDFGFDAQEWAEDGVGRALMTVIMLIDYEETYPENAEADVLFDSYVAFNEEEEAFVIVVGRNNNTTIVFLYSRGWENGSVLVVEGMDTEEVVEKLSQGYTFTKNTTEDFNAIAEALDK